MPGLDLGLVFVSDSSSVGLLVQGKECIAQRAFTKQRRAGTLARRVECHVERQVVSQVFVCFFLKFILGFWACLQTGVNVILLVPGTNPFRSVYQTIDSPSVPTM